MKWFRGLLASMAGRMFMILLLGMILSAAIAIGLTSLKIRMEMSAAQENHAIDIKRSVDRLERFVKGVDASSGVKRDNILAVAASSFRVIEGDQWQDHWGNRDSRLEEVLAARHGPLATAVGLRVAPEVCEGDSASRESSGDGLFPDCYLIRLVLSDGTPLQLAMVPNLSYDGETLTIVIFSLALLLTLGLLAYLVTRLASRPLSRLSDAAEGLGENLHREPIKEIGPAEVRRAVRAFNAMQRRIQKHLDERTRMLAAISHDLQTPLTRMRLRLEKVGEGELREKLVADVSSMQALIREGLELARSTETSEQPVSLDLDSLLESLVEDAVDAGGRAEFVQGCGSVLHLRPLAVRRLFSNLIDNALKYAGAVEVLATREEGRVVVSIRDRGPGLPEDHLEAVFEPFRRVESSRSRNTGGSGLGLTIARTLAETNGATLVLRNRAGGGLEALVSWPGRYLAA